MTGSSRVSVEGWGSGLRRFGDWHATSFDPEAHGSCNLQYPAGSLSSFRWHYSPEMNSTAGLARSPTRSHPKEARTPLGAGTMTPSTSAPTGYSAPSPEPATKASMKPKKAPINTEARARTGRQLRLLLVKIVLHKEEETIRPVASNGT